MADQGFIGGIASALGGSDKAPKAITYPGSEGLLKRTAGVGRDVLENLRGDLPDFFSGFKAGTERQADLQGEQEGILRNLLARRLNSDPEGLLQRTGNTLFSFINPNVIDPLAKFDVNYDTIARRARGLSPAAYDSTAQRLRNARIASQRYYDVARDVYGRLPQVYQQLRDAGVTDEMLASGYIPQIQAGYRALDYAPLEGNLAAIGTARAATGIPADYGAAYRVNTYGYKQPRNFWDRLGQAGGNVMDFAKDAAAIYSQLYGGGVLGGGGATAGAGVARPATAAPSAAGYPYFQTPQYINPPAYV